MGADLHIHVCNEGEFTERDFIDFGSSGPRFSELFDRFSKTDSIWVGEWSLLKAMVTGDRETFIPDALAAVSENIPMRRAIPIDDALIEKIDAALRLPNKSAYHEGSNSEKILDFLRKNRGRQAFTISW